MPRKKIAAKTTKKTTKATVRISKTKKVARPVKRSFFDKVVDHLKLGESYTSLVLGIIAVIIGTMILLSVIHSHQSQIATPEVTPTIAQSNSFDISPTGVKIQQPEATSMPQQQLTATPTPEAQTIQAEKKQAKAKVYIVAAGDNLWMIAQTVYGDGYKWVDIAKANNLADPGDIHVGDKLVTPDATLKELKDATVHTADDNMSTSTQTSIIGSSYTVVAGDTLWSIAVRAYGDGYQWVKIAQANNLADPDVIHKDNVLKIPRV